MAEVTPTVQEFVYSFLPTRTIPTNLEGLLYFDIKMAFVLGGMYARTFYIMVTTGKSFADAGYVATNTWSMFKWMKTPGVIYRGTRVLGRGVPVLAVPIIVNMAAQDIAYSGLQNAAYVASSGREGSRMKPSWIPLPLWALLHGYPQEAPQAAMSRNARIGNFYANVWGGGFFFS